MADVNNVEVVENVVETAANNADQLTEVDTKNGKGSLLGLLILAFGIGAAATGGSMAMESLVNKLWDRHEKKVAKKKLKKAMEEAAKAAEESDEFVEEETEE